MKRILAIALAAVMFTAQSAFAAEFEDIEGHWAEGTIRILAALGVVDGVTDTEFQPEGQVTRAQYLKMLMETIGISTEPFRAGECLDVNYDDWFAPYVQGALDKGLIPKNMITGYKASVQEVKDDEGNVSSSVSYIGAFNGNLVITREEMAYLSSSLYQYILNANTMKGMASAAELEFIDNGEISEWAVDGVKMAVANRFIEGMDDNSFAPLEHTTRAQAAAVVERIMNKLNR